MKKLVNNHDIIFGYYDQPVENVNYLDYQLESPMRKKKSDFFKKIKFNQFVFAGIFDPQLIVGIGIVDIKFIKNVFLYIYDRRTNELTEEQLVTLLPWSKISINPNPNDFYGSCKTRKINVELNPNGFNAETSKLSIQIKPDFTNRNPMRVCTRTGYTGWTYTEKTTPIKITGQIGCKGKTYNLSEKAYAFFDWTGGYMRRETNWNWAACAGVIPGTRRTIGLNLANGVNETGFSENAFWIDNEMNKIDMVNFMYDKNNFLEPWKITSLDKKINLNFQVPKERFAHVDSPLAASDFYQLFGIFSGELKTSKGGLIKINGLPGIVEDHYAKW